MKGLFDRIEATKNEITILKKSIAELNDQIEEICDRIERCLLEKYDETFGKKFGDIDGFRVRTTDTWVDISFHYKHLHGLACEESFETKIFNHVCLTVWSTENKYTSVYPTYPEIKDELIEFFKRELKDAPERYKI